MLNTGVITVSYIIAIILFILALGGLSNQETARRGNLYGIVGMAIALVSVGLGMVALRDRTLGRMDESSVIRTARIWIVPIAAFAVMAIGVFLVVRAASEISGL